MRETEAFWGLAPDARVRAGDGAVRATWARVVLDDGPHGLGALTAGVPVTVPLLQADPVGEPLVTCRLESGERAVLAAAGDDGAALAFDADAAVAALTTRTALTARPPVSARLPFGYRRLPDPVRRVLRDVLVRASGRRGAAFPAWPIEPSAEVLRHVALLARRAVDPEAAPAPFWPDGKRFALVLTHDVDSAGGQDVGLQLKALEAEHGLRSAWYVVGRDWPPDFARLDALADGGHEVGLHDAHHDNRGAFLTPEDLGARLDGCADLAERYAMAGYRSPSMLRTDAMYTALRGRFAYDTSMPDTGLLPKPNGCATVFPLERGGVPVLPLTLPPDGQLAGLGLDAEQIAARWIEKAGWIARAGGVAMILTHPEPGFSAEPMLQDAYRRFLAWAAARDDAWHALPREVAAHAAQRAERLAVSSAR